MTAELIMLCRDKLPAHLFEQLNSRLQTALSECESPSGPDLGETSAAEQVTTAAAGEPNSPQAKNGL